MAEPPPDALRIVDLLDRLALYQRSRQHAAGLNPAQWEALRYLGRANRYSRNPGALSRFLQTTKGTASQTIISLERKRLLRRIPGTEDRRGVALEITREGEALLRTDPLNELAKTAARLPAASRHGLAGALGDLLVALQRNAGNRAFGICRTCRFFRRNDARGRPGGPHRCGLTGEPLADPEMLQICAEHDAAA